MKMRDLTYHEPKSLREACDLLSRYGDDARIIAGGTDLLVDLKQRNIEVTHLISLSKLEGLNRIESDEGRISIGAMVTLNSISASPLIKERLPALSEAAASMASNQIRNLGTAGGNIASAVPSADLPPVLLSAGASVVLAGPDGDRRTSLAGFFVGPRATVMARDEVISQIVIPDLPPTTGIAYEKIKLRGANALAVVGVAAGITMRGEVIDHASIVLGAVAPVPTEAKRAADSLRGHEPDPSLFKRAGKIAAEEASPISDIRGSEEYRREMVGVLTTRALKRARSRAAGGM